MWYECATVRTVTYRYEYEQLVSHTDGDTQTIQHVHAFNLRFKLTQAHYSEGSNNSGPMQLETGVHRIPRAFQLAFPKKMLTV